MAENFDVLDSRVSKLSHNNMATEAALASTNKPLAIWLLEQWFQLAKFEFRAPVAIGEWIRSSLYTVVKHLFLS